MLFGAKTRMPSADEALPEAARDLEVRVSPFLLPRLALHDERALREVEMHGDAEFAHEVSFLARHLRWDVEEDLSHVVGDIAAHRAVGGARAAAEWAVDAAQRTAAGAAEYWTEERPLIASRVKVAVTSVAAASRAIGSGGVPASAVCCGRATSLRHSDRGA